MIFRPLMSVLEFADSSQVRWFVREQMMAARLDELLEIR